MLISVGNLLKISHSSVSKCIYGVGYLTNSPKVVQNFLIHHLLFVAGCPSQQEN
jgi:hypothetical protein